jgi:N-acetylglucosaminyldiphosphoundecaprenol N-acetyl-beta-D-mannosaminyltransferase
LAGVILDDVPWEELNGADTSRGFVIMTVAPWQYWVRARRLDYRAVLDGADVRLVDGEGVRLALGLAGLRVPRRTGRELVERVGSGELWPDRRRVVVGSSESTHARLAERHPDWLVLGGSYSDPPTPERVENVAAHLRPDDVVLVSLGCPKQELWASRLRKAVPALYVTIGGAVDTYAGVRSRPARWITALKLEWLQRAVQQPRLFPRVGQAALMQVWLMAFAFTARVANRFRSSNRG